MADIDTLAGDGGKAGLNAIKGGLGAIAGQMLDDGIPLPEIQALLSEVNNDVYRRITDLTLVEIASNRADGQAGRQTHIVSKIAPHPTRTHPHFTGSSGKHLHRAPVSRKFPAVHRYAYRGPKMAKSTRSSAG
ncbi:MAG: hypothetical protein ACKVJQ_10180 [Alphaproteobacteria bacterium]|jgi:hypothetical protein